MSKSNNHKSKSGLVNKADELRQLKLKKIEDTNLKISKQLDRSAESWKNSMEQIRKIAKKSQDSSQILDNVFTENDNDRSDAESEFPRGYPRSLMGDSPYYHTNPPYYGPFRPVSQHAYYSSNYINQGLQSRMYNSQYPQNMNQSNTYNFPQTPLPRFAYNRPLTSYQPELNQSNSTLLSPYTPFGNYNPTFPRPCNFYPPVSYPNVLASTPNVMASNPNYFQQPQMFHPLVNQYRPYAPPKDVGGVESIKKYVNSLLDKLERLNDTVAKLKNENMNRQRVRECSHNHEQFTRSNPGYYENLSYHPPFCCSHKVPVQQTSRQCGCWDLHRNQSRRPHSSIGENNCYKTPCHYNPNKNFISSTKMYGHNCTVACDQQKPPRTFRDANTPTIRRQESQQCLPSFHNSRDYSNHNHPTQTISQCTRSSFVRAQTPSIFLDSSNSLPGVALVVDNSNNNNLSNVLVTSSDLTGDLSSLSELHDLTM